MVSVKASLQHYEIWLYARPAFRLHVEECGSFESEEEAERVGGLVRLWLQCGIFGPELRAVVPDENDAASLFALPELLRAWGHDPALVMVDVKEEKVERCDAEVPADQFWRTDAGRTRAPESHDEVHVRAKRR